MTTPTNTQTSLVAIGNREDLSDVIYRVAPVETPFFSGIGTSKAMATKHEWQTETLASASASNFQLEGDVFSIASGNLTTRLGNYCQIFSKAYGVSRTEEIVKKAGRTSELNRQKVLKGLELRRDCEMTLTNNVVSGAESGATPRKSAGALAWITSNTSVGAGGSNGGFSAGTVSAATNGTLRNFSEAQIKTVMSAAFSAGGKPTTAFMGPNQKQEFSAFTGIATIRHDSPGAKMAQIIGAADVYVSDFGNLALVPHPYALTRDCLIVDPTKWAVAMLDGFKSTELAQSSDSTQYALTVELTLESRNEKASGAIRDIQ
jgi:hypothetical protein